MSGDPPPRGAMPNTTAPTAGSDARAQHAGAAWASMLPTPVAGPTWRFARAGAGLDAGTRLGENGSSPPGQLAVLMAALLIGLLLMAMQLWLLTVALDLYLGGQGRQIWLLALVSGAIFAGGMVMLRMLGRRPRVSR